MFNGNTAVNGFDEDGQFFWIPLVGAAIGGYAGYKIGEARGANGLEMFGYVLGGAAIGGVSGYLGGSIAAGGGAFSQSGALMAGSYMNSTGMSMLSGGMTDWTMSFGFASYNFTKGEFGYLGKKGNSTLENIGYGLGAMANLNDAWNIAFPSKQGTNLYTDADDPIISHSAFGDSESDRLLSFGPDRNNPYFYENIKAKGIDALSFGSDKVSTIQSYAKFAFGIPRKGGFWDYSHYNNWKLAISNLNKIPLRGVSYLTKILPYQGLTANCVNVASLGGWLSGIPNIGLHPWLFHASMSLYTMGVRPDLFSYYLINQ